MAETLSAVRRFYLRYYSKDFTLSYRLAGRRVIDEANHAYYAIISFNKFVFFINYIHFRLIKYST
jgi:hypothetical protein